MKYIMYNEENSVIHYDEYEEIKDKITYKYMNFGRETIVRKVKFVEDKFKLSSEDDIQNKPAFSLCMKLDGEFSYYLEKKSRQNEMIYKTFINLTKDDCIKILNRDIDWIKNSKKPLVKEFYLYLTINNLEPSTLMEYRRLVFEKPGKHCVVFNEEIRRAMDKNAGLLDENIQMFDCLSCDKIVMSYKNLIKIPRALNSILHISNEKSVELAFSI
ncbi:MAG: VTC domain-containing protein [Lachnotalea sp.]